VHDQRIRLLQTGWEVLDEVAPVATRPHVDIVARSSAERVVAESSCMRVDAEEPRDAVVAVRFRLGDDLTLDVVQSENDAVGEYERFHVRGEAFLRSRRES